MPGEEFLDGPDEPSTRRQGPKLHNFRSGDLKKEEQHLEQSWEKCLHLMLLLSHTGLSHCTTKEVSVPGSYAQMLYTGGMIKKM